MAIECSSEASIVMSKFDGLIVWPDCQKLSGWCFLITKLKLGFQELLQQRGSTFYQWGHAPQQPAAPAFFHECLMCSFPKYTLINEQSKTSTVGVCQKQVAVCFFSKAGHCSFFLTPGDDIMWRHYYCFQASDSDHCQDGKLGQPAWRRPPSSTFKHKIYSILSEWRDYRSSNSSL